MYQSRRSDPFRFILMLISVYLLCACQNASAESSSNQMPVQVMLQFFGYKMAIDTHVIGNEPFLRLQGPKSQNIGIIELNENRTVKRLDLRISNSDDIPDCPAKRLISFLSNPESNLGIRDELAKFQKSLPAPENGWGDSAALVRPELLGHSIAPLTSESGFKSQVKGEEYFRLVEPGQESAFAVVQIDSRKAIIGFEPLIPLTEIANLPECPALRLARKISSAIPERNEDSAKILAQKTARREDYEKIEELFSQDDVPAASNAVVVQQGQGISSDMLLFTQGLYTCIGLAAYNPETKKSFLIHADASTDVDDLIAKLSGQLGPGPRIGVIASGDLDPVLLDKILIAVEKNSIKLKARKFVGGIGSLSVDPASGTFR